MPTSYSSRRYGAALSRRRRPKSALNRKQVRELYSLPSVAAPGPYDIEREGEQ